MRSLENTTETPVSGGTYADKQLFCKDRIVAWSHRSRYELGRRLVDPHAGQRILDYGCGDGTFLALVQNRFSEAVGADLDPRLLADCRKRFAEFPGLSFTETSELAAHRHSGSFGVVTCMEVLEHCVEEAQDAVIADLKRLVSLDGVIVISVPIEIGPTLVGKQLVRAIAGWRRLGDYEYREKYTPAEFVRMMFATDGSSIERPIYYAESDDGRLSPYHGHKGFNWRSLSRKLQNTFLIDDRRFSPVGWLGGLLSSQAWFVCHRRRDSKAE